MQSNVKTVLDELVQARLRSNADQIRNSLAQIAIGNPLAAEPVRERAIERIQAKTGGSRAEAESMLNGIREATSEALESVAEGKLSDGREAVWGSTYDFLDVSFLNRGRLVADSVARVAFRDGRPQGSGFLVAPNLFITNHHVLGAPEDAAQFCVQFRYERSINGQPRPVTSFAFDPAGCFVTDSIDGLDFTLVAVGNRLEGAEPLDTFGYARLSDKANKHMLGEVANVIQHPSGRFKEVVLRENQLVGRDEYARVLHYIADTEPGSSGSPVFNNEWEPVALHHWGGPWLEGKAATGAAREINEGIRISEIVKFLRARLDRLNGGSAAAVRSALQLWDNGTAPRAKASNEAYARAGNSSEGGEMEDFSDRGGYESGFLPGVHVPLPKLARNHTPARNLKALIGEDPYELRYHHFSIVMNAERRLAYFTACNIDGSRVVQIDRSSKTANTDPTIQSMDLESAEAGDAFRPDPRVRPDEQMTIEFYQNQKIRGYPDARDRGRIARMFQKGHITLRSDPSWGTVDEATAAERDTFFYTNAAPQVGYFNQGSALDHPGTKGKLRWRAVETYVLRNAMTMRQRVTVFAGPIFAAGDPEYREGAKVPMRFWKIAVWVDDAHKLRSIALVADQKDVLTVMPEAMEDAEAFLDGDELARVSQFLTTVAAIEKSTGLDFGQAVNDADVRQGETKEVPVTEGVSLTGKRQGRTKGSGPKKGRRSNRRR